MKAVMQKYIEMSIIKKAQAKFQAYMKINRNITQTHKKKKEEDLEKELEKIRNDIMEIKKAITNKNKY